jgi:cell division protein FtsB
MSSHKPIREASEEATGVRRWLQQMYGQRRRFATVAAAVLALAVGYHVVFGQNGLTAYEKKKQEDRALAVQVKALEDENDALKGHVDRLANDPGAIEHQAREALHYTRPGEVIVTLPAEPVKAAEKK